jgi:hypothetical protein
MHVSAVQPILYELEPVIATQEYVCRLAELLVEAKSDPETPAGKRAAVLVREAVTLAATISIHNPRGYRTW